MLVLGALVNGPGANSSVTVKDISMEQSLICPGGRFITATGWRNSSIAACLGCWVGSEVW